ncbi:MAG: NADH-quinone oxidoreductase subunit C [Candidatus Thorarchaeota archaeon]|nr:NADH-quinone oxidoreductase subunit C [Candidatus Thorarchaeota archaeon]
MTESPSALAFARSVTNRYPDVQADVIDEHNVKLSTPPERIRDVVSLIDSGLSDAFPESVFGVDLTGDQYELIYYFWSHNARLLCQVRVRLTGPTPSVHSVADMFPGLEWHERETHEMFGIQFVGHPDLRPLLLPEELRGKYPLRKSFQTDRSRLEESGLPLRGGASE